VSRADPGRRRALHTLLAALLLLALPGWLQAAAQAASAAGPAAIELFVREGCLHCAEAEAFVAALQRERPGLRAEVRDVGREPAALARLERLVREHGTGTARVPAFRVGGQLIVGYSAQAGTGLLIRLALAGAGADTGGQSGAASGAAACTAQQDSKCERPPEAQPPERFEVALFGRPLALDAVGLPAFTVAVGLLDGLNPCSMWVLVLMISLLAPLNDRKRMIVVAGTFVLVEGVAYFAFMSAWLNLFLLIGLSRASELVVAAIAIVAGSLNLKDAVAPGGLSLSIPAAAKPGIYQRLRAILHAPGYAAAVAGTVVLALLVQLVELMCTSGFPALFTRILTLRVLDTGTYYAYLLLYNAAYMLDDVIVLAIGVAMLSRHRLQEREGRLLKLLSGVAMIGLAVYLAVGGR
jgi:hypothetical protein